MTAAEELEALLRRASVYHKLRPYAPAGLEAILAVLRERIRSLTLAARLEARAARD